MPGYRMHDGSTLVAAAVGGAICAALTHSAADAGLLGGATLISGTMLSPDLDIFANPSLKYVVMPYGNVFRRIGKMASGTRDVFRFGAVSSSKPLQRWGPLRFIWVPYRMALFGWWTLFGRKSRDTNFGHRSIWSHTPGIADVVRLGYLTFLVCLVGGFILHLLHRGDGWALWQAIQGLAMSHQRDSLLVLAGCSLATAVHCALDARIPD